MDVFPNIGLQSDGFAKRGMLSFFFFFVGLNTQIDDTKKETKPTEIVLNSAGM